MTERSEIDLRDVVLALRRRAGVILLIAVVAGALAYGLSALQDESYTATAELLFRETNPGERVVEGSPLDVREEPQRLAATNVALASLDTVVVRVRERLGLRLSVEELRERVELTPAGQADILEVTAAAPEPQGAVRLANTFAEEIVTFRREASQRRVQRGIDALNERIAAAGRGSDLAAGLRERRRELEVLKAVQTGDVEVAEEAIAPPEPNSPNPTRNAAVGGGVGLILGVMLALILRRFDRRVSGEDEVARILQAPILAQFPELGHGAWKEQVFRDALQFMRSNLEFFFSTSGQAGRTTVIVITSPNPGAGKTTLVARLGDAFARGNRATVVVDADLRRPMLSTSFEVLGEGLAEALTESYDAAELLSQTAVPTLRILPAGSPLKGESALQQLNVPQVRGVLEEMHHSDIVLVDTAPVAIGPETSVMAAAADGVVLVVDLHEARRDALQFARDQLRYAGAKVLGVVINRSATQLSKSDYGGSYGPAFETSSPPSSRSRGPSRRSRSAKVSRP